MGIYDTISGSGREPYIKGAVQCPCCGLNLHPSIDVCPACDQNMRAPHVNPYQQPMQQQFAPQYGAPQAGAAAAFGQDMSNVPPAPSEETPTGQGPMMAAQSQQAAPGAVIGVIQHDIMIGEAVAFRHGERVQIEAESPDPERPEYRFVVFCPSLNKRFRLSDLDVLF